MVDVFLSTGYPVGFFSTEPLANLKEIKGTKWRSASFWHLDYLLNVGAVPVNIHWGPEVYEALEKKTLDGIMVNVDSGYNLKVHEHAPYVLASKDLWLGHLYLVTINKNTWNTLTKEDKDAIQRAAKKAYKTLGTVMDKSFDTQMETLKNEGAKIRLLSKKETDEFKVQTKYEEVQDKWVKEQKVNGIEAGPALGKVRALLNKTMK